MPKKPPQSKSVKVQRPGRAKLSRKESLKRVREFAQRKEEFVAVIRKGKGRGISA